MARVYVLDDDPVVLTAIRSRLEGVGHEVVTSGLWSELARGLIARCEPGSAALVCDLHMPGIDGADFIRIVRRYNADLPVVLFSGDQDDVLAQAATSCGANAGLHKGDIDGLASLIARLLAKAGRLALTA